MTSRSRKAAAALAVLLLAALLLAACTRPAAAPRRTAGLAPAVPGPAICGSSILNSPWSYHGSAGTFTTSGTPAGLPTFGAPGTDFPSATEVIAVAAGDNTAAALAGNYQANNAVIYFEPGMHDIQNIMYTGLHSAYVGGYDAADGRAILNGVDGATGGTGNGGSRLTTSTPATGHVAGNTYEYLTVENYAADVNGDVIGEDGAGFPEENNTFKYDTIGPNQYGFHFGAAPWLATSSSPGQGGGYGIGAGSYSVIEYNCIKQNAQGGINSSGAVDLNIASNEISQNGLGLYPDAVGTGASPKSCGCSGGMKVFLSINARVVNNYVHDNYNVGIWFDYENTGADISHNYIASNWNRAIWYEASYNADISGNTLTGNAWASDGAWPAGVGGGTCFNGVTCTGGQGPTADAGFPFASVYIANSMGNATLGARVISIPSTTSVPGCSSSCTITSDYPGHIYVQGNVIRNDFGGVMAYADLSRFPGDIYNNETCSAHMSYFGAEDPVYYTDRHLLVTSGDATISGSTVTSTGGTQAQCQDYNTTGSAAYSNQYSQHTAAPVAGEQVYDQATGTHLGQIATVTSANSFTLSTSPGNQSGLSLVISSYGGCGPADYAGAANPGDVTGTPAAAYWDNCLFGSKNITVSGNSFTLDANTVTPCSSGDGCGGMVAMAFRPGIAVEQQFWWNYPNLIADAASALGNVWSGNTYTWTGSGTWSFMAGNQGNAVTQSAWTTTYHQDSGSTFH